MVLTHGKRTLSSWNLLLEGGTRVTDNQVGAVGARPARRRATSTASVGATAPT